MVRDRVVESGRLHPRKKAKNCPCNREGQANLTTNSSLPLRDRRRAWKPRKGVRHEEPRGARGPYLERSRPWYSSGTEIPHLDLTSREHPWPTRSHAATSPPWARGSCSAPRPSRPPPKKKPTSATVPRPVESAFERDYPAPGFKPSWKKPQINRLLVQDFVIYAHSELDMVRKLLEKQPALLNATMDWGGGDWETGLGGASHMGRRDIVEPSCSTAGRASTSSAPR